MENRAQKFTNSAESAPALVNVNNLLSAMDDYQASSQPQHILAKYLPLNTFKNPQTLTAALDKVSREIHIEPYAKTGRRLDKSVIDSILSNLAKNIALTTVDLNTDYTTKISLIETALEHRLFKSSSMIKRMLVFILSRTRQDHSDRYRSAAELILQSAKTSIQQSRNHIILC